MNNMVVVGAGGWGTALARTLAVKHGHVILWARQPDTARELAETRENKTYLPGVSLPPQMEITSDLEYALRNAEVVISAVPAQSVRNMMRQMRPFLNQRPVIISVSKGLEKGTHLRMTQVIEEELPRDLYRGVAALSGPNHAEEVGREIPSVTVVASNERRVAQEIQNLFMCPNFRVYTNQDVVGVEIGGSLKNVIALASGISDGLGFGDNTKAALMTRGMAEITRLGISLGAHPLTFGGLSGMGDLIATCTSQHSRNTTAGRALGQGKTLQEVLSSTKMVVEGVWTTAATYELSKIQGVEMPLTQKVYEVLYEGKSPRDEVTNLMQRDPTYEEASYGGYV